MSYVDEVLNKLGDSDNWPYFERADFLDDLNEVADKAFEAKTTEGYLSSVLIYQQLTEEFVRILIECGTFFIQLLAFPNEYKDRNIKKMMFGQLIQELEQSILDDETYELIDKAKRLNTLRISIVHKLTKKDTISSISEECDGVKELFSEIQELFDDIYDRYRVTFKDYLKDIDELKESVEEI